jgi:hypothetical protein
MPPAGNDQLGPPMLAGVDGRLFFRDFLADFFVFFVVLFLAMALPLLFLNIQSCDSVKEAALPPLQSR